MYRQCFFKIRPKGRAAWWVPVVVGDQWDSGALESRSRKLAKA